LRSVKARNAPAPILASELVVVWARQPKTPNPEVTVFLEQLLLGLAVVGVVFLLLPLLLVMAGVGTVMLLWFVVSAAVLGALVFWLMFPGTYGLAVLLVALVIGLLLVDRRSRHGAS
jgi:hypothetical protein